MRESRLFKIVYHLLDKGQATAGELAEKFEVSVRTIYRDVDALSAAGIPVYAEAGRNGGIHLMNGFVLDRAVLSEGEKQEILTAVQSLTAVGSVYEDGVFEKLSALFNVRSENWLEVDFSPWGDKPRNNPKFEMLKSAIIQHKCINITYAGSYDTIYTRKIQPLKLLYKSKAWYLKAFCTQKQDFRIFKLNRILKLELLEEKFLPVTFPRQDNEQMQTYKRITLRFPKEMAYRVYDEFDINQVKEYENEDLVVTSEMPEDKWLIGYLLSFATQVEIIEPAYLKNILAEKAKEIFEKNKS